VREVRSGTVEQFRERRVGGHGVGLVAVLVGEVRAELVEEGVEAGPLIRLREQRLRAEGAGLEDGERGGRVLGRVGEGGGARDDDASLPARSRDEQQDQLDPVRKCRARLRGPGGELGELVERVDVGAGQDRLR